MTKLGYRMMITETDIDYLTSHFARVSGMVVYHNVLRDMSTACGMQLIYGSEDIKSEGEPRCGRCVRTVDAITKVSTTPEVPLW